MVHAVSDWDYSAFIKFALCFLKRCHLNQSFVVSLNHLSWKEPVHYSFPPCQKIFWGSNHTREVTGLESATLTTRP